VAETDADRVYRGAVTGADAYRAVRSAIRLEGEVLRIGNRFVRAERYEEIAFLALGRAAVSAGFGVLDALGESVTQGFLAGPDELPERIPFLHQRTRSEALGTTDAEAVIASVLELAGGLHEKDLLLVVLSPGALGLLSAPPTGMGRDGYLEFLRRLTEAGARSAEIERFVRATSFGAAGGRLAAAAGRSEVVTLIVDRDGVPEASGGGPTRAVRAEERTAANALLSVRGIAERTPVEIRRALSTAPALPEREAARPVVVATPAEAIQGAGDALSEAKWWSRLATLSLSGGPAEAAQEFSDRVEEVLRGVPKSRQARKGIAIFAGAPLECIDGEGEGAALARLLPELKTRARRRTLRIVAFRTAGARPGDVGLPAGLIEATGAEIRPVPAFRAGRPGVTDVGPVVAALLPESEEP
jgi:glycerate-2-kinase